MTDGDINEVRVAGRVSAVPREITLPSGDLLVSMRLVVRRPEAARRHSTVSVDTIEVVAWRGRARQALRKLEVDQQVEVVGSLRRRFWRTGTGPASRYEVEAERVRKVA